MLRNERYDFVLNHFRDALPNVTTELQFGSAFQLLVATLLSAQCTDKRINMVTPALFARYPDALHMAQAGEEDIYELISSVSYPMPRQSILPRCPVNWWRCLGAKCLRRLMIW